MANNSKLYFIGAAGSTAAAGTPVGLRLLNNSGTLIGVASGSAGSTSGALMVLPTAVVINMATNGALGLDTGAIAAATAYQVWLLKNPTTDVVTAIASISYTLGGVTKPTGYTLGRRIGSFHTLAAAATILPFTQEGDGTDRRYLFTVANAARAVLTSGVATVATEVVCNSCLPLTATSVRLSAQAVSSATGSATLGLNTSLSSTVITNTKDAAVAAAYQNNQVSVAAGVLASASTNVGLNYLVSAATTALTLVVDGYTESLVN